MSRSRQYAADDNHQGRGDDGDLSAKVVASQANNDLANDFADQQGIGNLGTDSCGILLFERFPKKHVGHCPIQVSMANSMGTSLKLIQAVLASSYSDIHH